MRVTKKLYDIEFKPNLKRVKSRLNKAKRKLTRMESAHAKIAIFLDRWVQRNFKTEGGNVGRWPPLKGGRSIKDPTAKILQDTGRLRASFLPFYSRRTAGIGSDLPYSKSHEKGIGRLPKRRMLPLQKDVRKDVTQIFNMHVKSSFR